MFPPVPTDKLEKMLEGLYESLAHVGDDFHGACTAEDVGGEYKVYMKLNARLPATSVQPIKDFIRGYAAASNWYAKTVEVKNGYVSFYTRYVGPTAAR